MKIIAAIGWSYMGGASPPEDLRYKIYADVPIAYVYSKLKNHDFVPTVSTFCSDIGFDGHNFFNDFDKNE